VRTLARVTCHICQKVWDSATEAESAEWVEVAKSIWKPTCPPCHARAYPGVPRRSARSLGAVGTTLPAWPRRVEAPYRADD
jgi:cytochrome c5